MSDENTQMQKIDEPGNGGLSRRDRYAPRDFKELLKFANVIVESQLCPSHINRPEDAVMIVQQGAELGLSPMQALQNMHSIKGKVGLGADLMKGICQSSGEVDKWEYEESTDERCALRVKRKGREELPLIEWTIDDARDKGLVSGSNVWQTYPRQMLRHRADAEAARSAFPDLLSGLYTPEELRAIPEGQGQGRQRQPRQQPETRRQPEGSKQDEDVVDAEYTESSQARSGAQNGSGGQGQGNGHAQQTHWTKRDFSDNGDQSNADGWEQQNKRFWALLSEADVPQSRAEDVRQAIKDRHGVESWKQIPAAILEQWNDQIENKPAESDGNQPPERNQWTVEFTGGQ